MIYMCVYIYTSNINNQESQYDPRRCVMELTKV